MKKSYYFPGLGCVSAKTLSKTEYFQEGPYDDKQYCVKGYCNKSQIFLLHGSKEAVEQQAPKIQEAMNEVSNE